MRVLLAVILLFALVMSGCARKKAAPSRGAGSPRAGAAAATEAPLAPQQTAVTGEVAKVNPVARFVVLSFPLGPMPALDQQLNLYRKGAKVAEVKVTGPQRDKNIIADIVTGTPEVGDEARAD